MIISASYFTNDIFIPQVGDGASNVANDNSKLNNAISKYEAEILVKGLGRKLYKEFITNIDPNTGLVVGGADPMWDELLNGKEYTKDGEEYYWRGLVDQTGDLKESLMAYYVYYNYVREGAIAMTTMGVKNGKSQNTTDADATPKLVNAWRSLYDWYMGSNESYKGVYMYKGHYVEDYFSGNNSNDVALYQYLQDHKDTYTDWSFTPIENKNTFGI